MKIAINFCLEPKFLHFNALTLQRFKRSLPVINTHRSAKQIYDSHIFQPQFPHSLTHSTLRRIMFQRFQNVRIRSRIPAKHESQSRREQFQVSLINPPPHPVLRLAKFQNQQSPRRLGHSLHLPQPRLPTGEIPQPIPNRDHIKRPVRKGNVLRVPTHKLHPCEPGSSFGLPFACNFEHPVTEIQTDDFCPSLC